ncbi:MAG: carbon starvation protein A, partial [Planctomycetota bacterium]
VLVFYLVRRGLPFWFAAAPAALMLVVPGWAMTHQLATDFVPKGKWPLAAFGLVILALQAWMIVEALLVWPRARGVLEEALPPIDAGPDLAGGRTC